MTNDDSYKMMQAMRRYLKINVYQSGKTLEVVLNFKTEDGKIHQLCSSFKEDKRETNGVA